MPEKTISEKNMLKKEPHHQSITVQNQPAETETLFQFLLKFITENRLPDNTQNDLRLVIEETFINIVRYGYPDTQSHEIEVKLCHSDNRIELTFIDTGKAFNPLTDAEKFNAHNEHSEGGMGIHLIKSLTDNQTYKRTKQTNVFILTKHYTN